MVPGTYTVRFVAVVVKVAPLKLDPSTLEVFVNVFVTKYVLVPEIKGEMLEYVNQPWRTPAVVTANKGYWPLAEVGAVSAITNPSAVLPDNTKFVPETLVTA